MPLRPQPTTLAMPTCSRSSALARTTPRQVGGRVDRVDVALVEVLASTLDHPPDARTAIELCRERQHARRSCPRDRLHSGRNKGHARPTT